MSFFILGAMTSKLMAGHYSMQYIYGTWRIDCWITMALAYSWKSGATKAVQQ
ncbi:unnamed protein product [Cylicostephanus goldi]|uniref:Uncharacterized protein n=1 Tax=Cylicostephanus goldi TaxID=71465 RepID=A0A3P6S230_CYLGO|nr:unnamed protein product [Cylicostephanus goldi]